MAVAFDSGGVTTGPMTVPFIMALGVGFTAIRSDKHAENDSFGLVAMCSIGPHSGGTSPWFDLSSRWRYIHPDGDP